MGSLADGTLCSYCDIYEASYIPDGCCGPLCGECMDIGIAGGYDQVFIFRLERWIRAHFWRLSPRQPRRHQTLMESVFHHPLVALHISQFMIEVADGWAVGMSGDECDVTDQSPR